MRLAEFVSVASKKSLFLGLNISSSVMIVFINRLVMSSWGFKFPSLLTGFHLLASGAFVRVLKGNAGSASFTFELDTILLILWAVSSLVSLNLSLMLNTVSFYQATKLLIVPCSAVIEYFLLNTPLSRWRIWCIVQTLVGVALVTINDLEFDISVTGFTIAMMSVLTSSLQQISVRKMQSEKQKSAMDLIAFIGPYSGMVLLTLSPLMDYKVSNQWITEFAWNPWVAGGVIVSAALAILVNISQYLCLGKFSAVEFQVMGHLKTVTVFIMCWLVLHESFSAIKWIGCLITIVGIYLFSRPPPQWRDPNGK